MAMQATCTTPAETFLSQSAVYSADVFVLFFLPSYCPSPGDFSLSCLEVTESLHPLHSCLPLTYQTESNVLFFYGL